MLSVTLVLLSLLLLLYFLEFKLSVSHAAFKIAGISYNCLFSSYSKVFSVFLMVLNNTFGCTQV